MREIFKAQLAEFHKEAYSDLFCTGEDGSGPSPMKGDRFFVMEESVGDEFNALFMWSSREEEYNEWNSNGWWQRMSDEDVPDEAIKLADERTKDAADNQWLEEMEELYSNGL